MAKRTKRKRLAEGRTRAPAREHASDAPGRSNLTVWLGVAAVVLGLGSLVVRLWRGDGIGFAALLPIAAGLLAIAMTGRLARR